MGKAADELHVTHGAVSQQLRVLEDTLGVSLFLRHGKRLSVTEDGRMYALRLRMALADLAEATDDVLALPREDELVLAVLPSFAAHWLVRRLPSLMRAPAGAEADPARQPGDGGFSGGAGGRRHPHGRWRLGRAHPAAAVHRRAAGGGGAQL